MNIKSFLSSDMKQSYNLSLELTQNYYGLKLKLSQNTKSGSKINVNFWPKF